MSISHRIVPCLWFDDQAEPAAQFYCSIFKNSRILSVSRFGEAGREIHGRQPGTVMSVEFVLDGLRFTALNGGPLFKFSEAVSLQVVCDDQDEIEHYWSNLAAGGDPAAQQCGWLKDQYGLSWQVVPSKLSEWMTDRDPHARDRTMRALLQMKKLDIAALKKANAG